MPDFAEVLDFWFGAPGSPERGRSRKVWFQKSDAFDAEIGRRFLPVWERAARGELQSWGETPLASLALVLVLDQFPRNMFRGTARAFSSDASGVLPQRASSPRAALPQMGRNRRRISASKASDF